MEENEVYVYLFTGFLESGKTSLIQGTIEEPDFMKGETGLLICCEEGEVEYDEALLKKVGIDMVVVEEQEDLTPAYLEELDKNISQIVYLSSTMECGRQNCFERCRCRMIGLWYRY